MNNFHLTLQKRYHYSTISQLTKLRPRQIHQFIQHHENIRIRAEIEALVVNPEYASPPHTEFSTEGSLS